MYFGLQPVSNWSDINPKLFKVNYRYDFIYVSTQQQEKKIEE